MGLSGLSVERLLPQVNETYLDDQDSPREREPKPATQLTMHVQLAVSSHQTPQHPLPFSCVDWPRDFWTVSGCEQQLHQALQVEELVS
jgi:hypothetical protein